MSAIGICVICKSVKKGEKLAVLYKRGADTLNAARLARNDNIPMIIVGNVIHENCRKSYCTKTIPPTSAAAKYHSLRTFFQVRTWMVEYYSDVLCPQQYGWEKRDDILQPIMTHLDPAPEYLLSITKCGCKGTCNSMRCSCRKNGIECSVSCTNCKGTNCSNCSLQNTNI